MKSLIKSKKTVSLDFEILFDRFYGKQTCPSEDVARAQYNLHKAFGLKEIELMIVTYIAHFYPNPVDCMILARKLCFADVSFMTEILNALVKKGFLTLSTTSSERNIVAISKVAAEAFRVGCVPQVDIVNMLRNSDPGQMEKLEWIRKFRTTVAAGALSSFAQGWTTLKADELTDTEVWAFCCALKQFICHFTEPLKSNESLSLESILNTSSASSVMDVPEFDNLVQKGLLVRWEEGYIISPTVSETLLLGHDEIVNYDEISKWSEVIKSGEIVQKELFYPENKRMSMERLRSYLSRDGFEKAKSVLVKQKRNPAIMALFYGGPGTGKTESVKQLASQTGRDIFLFDISGVTNSYVGKTEKNYKQLFRVYRYLVSVMKNAPILLFNEADQALSKRLSQMSDYVDKMSNSISNILLQAFEDMHGILIATTNNVDMIDNVFYRRFLFKIELQGTNAVARKSIWMDKIPGLSQQVAEYLSDKYEMSGAEIDNVVLKMALDESATKKDLRYLKELCEEELIIKKDSVAKCGF